ncbi:hypothetical protein [Bowmanella denitrificans]|uniref:hypothetical protein n=1 Tax=Bowmanella denitrificans TaxID=366582 RepID=UPI0011AFAAA5|nr:hypothetical protein [Bowmanella denitrificans]
MKIPIFFLLFFSLAALAQAEVNCAKYEAFKGQLFELEVTTSFRGKYIFHFCYGEQSYLISEFIDPAPVSGVPTRTLTHTSRAELTSKQAINLKKLYLSVQAGIRTDDYRGMDGSIWCFRPKDGFSFSETCLWTPEVKAEERGLSKLVELGHQAFRLSGFSE